MNVKFYPQATDGHGTIAVAVIVAGFEVRREVVGLDVARDRHARLGVAIERADGIEAALRGRAGKAL